MHEPVSRACIAAGIVVVLVLAHAARLAADLKEFENDELIEGEALRALIRWTSERRAKAGIPPLETRELDDIPELGLHERARALGMVKPRRTDPQRDN